MFKTLILKELFEHFKGYKFMIVFVSCFILLGFNHAVMYQDYKSKLADHHLKFPLGKSIEKMPEPLSIYVTGVNELTDRVIRLDDYYGGLIDLNVLNLSIYRQYFPLIDFNYLVRIILSFLAIVVGFDAICGEKQHGTLKLLLSNAIPRNIVIWGKIIGCFITLIVPFVFTTIFYYIILAFQPDVHFSASDNIRLLLIMLLSIVYLSIFLIISVSVSASSSTIKVSVIKNFIIWTILIFIIPNISSLIANNTGQLPDGRKIGDQYLIDILENNKHKTDSIAKEEAFFNYSASVLDYRNKLKKQVKVIEWSAILIPSNAYNLGITSLANCGLDDEAYFRNAIFQYHKAQFTKKSNFEFEYSSIPLPVSLSVSLKYYLWVLLFACIILIMMVKRFNIYDIR
jgi:ABC-type transport system involved in multi-copper enzyme maturation permease subunit